MIAYLAQVLPPVVPSQHGEAVGSLAQFRPVHLRMKISVSTDLHLFPPILLLGGFTFQSAETDFLFLFHFSSGRDENSDVFPVFNR